MGDNCEVVGMEIDCVDDVCDVGGLCEADNDIHCVCPGDVSGDTCETFFLETAVRIECAKVGNIWNLVSINGYMIKNRF